MATNNELLERLRQNEELSNKFGTNLSEKFKIQMEKIKQLSSEEKEASQLTKMLEMENHLKKTASFLKAILWIMIIFALINLYAFVGIAFTLDKLRF